MRRTASIWFWLFTFGYDKTWNGISFFREKIWNDSYFWHDSFGRFLWLIFCPIVGHDKQWNAIGNGLQESHCFRCERNFGRRETPEMPGRFGDGYMGRVE